MRAKWKKKRMRRLKRKRRKMRQRSNFTTLVGSDFIFNVSSGAPSSSLTEKLFFDKELILASR
ncbi:hypothetical protein Leryth_022827 [Lithospermum erythrorhizon]|nr:hypothetical protein Leryth_022827 [Lithospermum erythrorhizon]